MKKMFMLVVSLFVVGGLFIGCGSDNVKKLINGGTTELQDVTTNTPNATMTPEEQTTVDSAVSLNPANYEITSLLFASNTIASGSTPTFAINHNSRFVFVVGIKGISSGGIVYKTIEVDFSSSNAAVISNGATGFISKSNFYSDNNASITVNVSYKGITNTFNFTLKSNQANPKQFEGTWRYENGGDYKIMTFSGNQWQQETSTGGNIQKWKGTFTYTTTKLTVVIQQVWDGSGWVAGSGSNEGTYTLLNNQLTLVDDGQTYNKV